MKLDLEYILKTLIYGLNDCSDDKGNTECHYNYFSNAIDMIDCEIKRQNTSGKVSFDYDGCLSIPEIQEYATKLVKRGVEVWICTSRLSPKDAPSGEWNDDLFEVAKKVGIERKNIIFTSFEKSGTNKNEVLNDKGFIWHLDDDWMDLSYIKTDSDLIGISCFGNPEWERQCEELLN